MNTEIEKEIINRYCNKGYGLRKSGEPYGVSDYLVKKLLKNKGIKIRNFSEAAKLSNSNRRFTINDDYFKTENANMAYILGFIASDGTVRKNNNEIKITVATRDKELLEKIKEELSLDRNIKDYEDSKGYLSSTLAFTSEKIKKDLSKYGIVPNKTFIFKFPQNLNKKYWVDFIRGYFDGDGCISSAGPNAIRTQVCSATRDVLEVMIGFLEQEFLIPKPHIQVRQGTRGRKNYYFQYSSCPTRVFFEKVYYPNCLCLERKLNKFKKLVPRNLK